MYSSLHVYNWLHLKFNNVVKNIVQASSISFMSILWDQFALVRIKFQV